MTGAVLPDTVEPGAHHPRRQGCRAGAMAGGGMRGAASMQPGCECDAAAMKGRWDDDETGMAAARLWDEARMRAARIDECRNTHTVSRWLVNVKERFHHLGQRGEIGD